MTQTALETLHDKMLDLESNGYISEEEYATYRNLLDAVGLLEVLVLHTLHYQAMPHAHPDAARDAANARAVLEKLK